MTEMVHIAYTYTNVHTQRDNFTSKYVYLHHTADRTELRTDKLITNPVKEYKNYLQGFLIRRQTEKQPDNKD